jgi:hypothetical protein
MAHDGVRDAHELTGIAWSAAVRGVWTRVGLPLLMGWIAVAGPWALHLAVESALKKRVESVLARRTGAEVSIRLVRPGGLASAGLYLEGVKVRWKPRFGIQLLSIPRMRVRIGLGGPVRASIVVVRPVFKAVTTPKALRQLVRRLFPPDRARKGKKSRTRVGRGRSYDIKVVSGAANLTLTRGAVAQVQVGEVGAEFKKCGKGRADRCVALTLSDFHALARDHSWFMLRRFAMEGTVGRVSRFVSRQKWAKGSLKSLATLNIRRLRASGLKAGVFGLSKGATRPVRLVVASRAGFSGSLTAVTIAPDLVEIRALMDSPVPGGNDATIHGYADWRKGRLTVRARFDRYPLQYFLNDEGPVHARSALLTARVAAEANADGWIEVRGKAAMDADVRVDHRALAAHPVRWPEIRAYVEGRGRLDREGAEVELKHATVIVGRVAADLKLKASLRSGRTRAEMTVGVRTGRCQDLLDSLPGALAPALKGMKLRGRWGGRLSVKVDSARLDDLKLKVRSSGPGCRVAVDPTAANVHNLVRPFSVSVPDRSGKLKKWAVGPSNPHYRHLARLPLHLIRAFLTAEDRRFFRHRGFDLEQIRPALIFDLKHRGFYRGASSISQQLVKNVFLTHRRNIARKLQEAVLTWRLEQVLSKRRILELYLNVIELGPGIYGVRKASQVYFRREPHQLTPLQSLHLAAITPSPRRYYRQFKGGRITMAWLLKLRFLLNRMYRTGTLTRQKYITLRRSPLVIAAF